MRVRIRELKCPKSDPSCFVGQEVKVRGWIRTTRHQKTFHFLELNDGSTLSNLQLVVPNDLPSAAQWLPQLTTGAAIEARGTLVESPGKGQILEMQVSFLTVVGTCDSTSYPLQKKRHSFEFLRTIGHLRPRTNTLGAVARVRSALAFATHQFFQERGFLYIQTPIITGSDCEGAGKMFQVTTLDLATPPKTSRGAVDYSEDFFGRPTYLTVSGQLEAEIFASALTDVYTFGPTFRAENSNTSRHLAEFWMVEPEMAFADLNDDMDCAESYLKHVLTHALSHCQEDMQFFDRMISPGQLDRILKVVEAPFERASYTSAVRILEKAHKKFEFPVRWGLDLQSEHERYLVEEVFGKPVILIDYPKEIKAFYMRANDDQKTVAAMDVLVPKIGEVIGGSQREERLDLLKSKIQEAGLPLEEYGWYLELRQYGSVPHAGFGVGFERLVQFTTGMENVRDVVPFPRYPGKADF